MKKAIAAIIAIVGASLMMTNTVRAQHAHDHDHDKKADEPKEITVTGEIVDMACYLDHGATGAKHAECAKDCIESGLPVGIKATDGKTYLLIGEHKPMNKELVKYAAKTITVRGKFVQRDGGST